MLREWIEELDERYPQLSQWVGGRLDIELPAFLASTGVHLALLLTLAMVGYAAHTEANRAFESRVVDTSVGEAMERVQFQDLDQSDKPPSLTPAAGSFSPNLAPMTVVPPASASVKTSDSGTAGPAMPVIAKLDVQRATEAALPTTNLYRQDISIQGNGAEHVGGVEGAVDRIADEILRHLEKGRTLVVWAFDASGSLVAERQRLSKHIGNVYTHIIQLDEKSLASDGGLLTAVVAFGHDRKALTPEPTAETKTIIEAIDNVPLDETGVETTFGTVAEIVAKWGRHHDSKGHVSYKDAEGRLYKLMIIVVTDEVGDDESRLEEAVTVASRGGVPVYVLGSQALFGRVEGYMDYTDPKTKKFYAHLPVRQGPESLMVEQIRMPFWYTGYQYDMLDSGYGPYALSRLTSATGGIYFITRLGPSRMGFDPARMREYRPDWVSREQYEATVTKNPFRMAIINAALMTQQKLPGTPPLNFPPADTPEFKEAMRAGQVIAERTEYTVNEALAPISQVSKLRNHERSRRWQANYDLSRGRLLAMKVRCHEYNWLCAKMKRDPLKFTNPASNAWKLVPDDEIKASDQAAAAAKQAKTLLQRVLEEHPGTPWALFAQRELKDPFGFKWVETTVKPRPRNNNNDADPAKMKKTKPGPKPPDPPKL